VNWSCCGQVDKDQPGCVALPPEHHKPSLAKGAPPRLVFRDEPVADLL
jgi:hypothetical protein